MSVETGQDIRTMHPRELVRGLMRGEKAVLKLGYTVEAAVGAVESIQGRLTPREQQELLAYAEGFAHGMIEDGILTNPARSRRDPDA